MASRPRVQFKELLKEVLSEASGNDPFDYHFGKYPCSEKINRLKPTELREFLLLCMSQCKRLASGQNRPIRSDRWIPRQTKFLALNSIIGRKMMKVNCWSDSDFTALAKWARRPRHARNVQTDVKQLTRIIRRDIPLKLSKTVKSFISKRVDLELGFSRPDHRWIKLARGVLEAYGDEV